VDEHGVVLEILLQDERDTGAARRFCKKWLERLEFVPEKIVTDQLGSYQAALLEIPVLEGVKHVFVKSEARLNNRIERDHEHVGERPKPGSDSAREVHTWNQEGAGVRVKKKQRASRGWRSPPDALEVGLRCRDFTRKVFKSKRGSAGEAREHWRMAFQVWGEVLGTIRPS
jgi:transposase-like protein